MNYLIQQISGNSKLSEAHEQEPFLNNTSNNASNIDLDTSMIMECVSNFETSLQNQINSVHPFDNTVNNQHSLGFQHVELYYNVEDLSEGYFVDASQNVLLNLGPQRILTKVQQNGCSGELNSEIFFDYFYYSEEALYEDSSSNEYSIPQTRSQLTRVTNNSILTQFNDITGSIQDPFGGIVVNYGDYTSISTNNNLIAKARPNYVAFLGGFESGSRDYGIADPASVEEYEVYIQQPYGTIKSTLDSGLRYAIESFGDKKPWYDSYEDYSDDIRNIGKDHTILPEFRISTHMPYYVKDTGGNFRATNRAFLENDGSGINYRTAVAAISSSDQQYLQSYVIGDESSTIYEIQEENKAITKLDKITFTLSGIKKLLPYNGFYPQERTVQLANLFNDFLDNNIAGGYFKINGGSSPYDIRLLVNVTESADLFAKNTVMPYFFSPGILFNTIKSGISVDFPMLTASVNIFNTISSREFSTTKNVYIDDLSVSASYLLLPINARMPFESIIFPQNYIPLKPKESLSLNTYFDATGGTEIIEQQFAENVENSLLNIKFDPVSNPDKFYITDKRKIGKNSKDTVPFAYLKGDKIIDPSYNLAISNFLGEIPRFFLKDESMISFKSSEMKNWKFEIGKKYYFDLKMKKSTNLVMIESYKSDSHITGPTNIEKTMNGRYFGWPVSKQSGSRTADDNYVVHNDPAYAPFTPPYFEGEAILRFELNASRTSYSDSSYADFIKDITLSDFFPAISGAIGTGSEAYRNKMSIQDCVEVFGLGINPLSDNTPDGKATGIRGTTDTANQFWVISPKLETPVLDFSEQQFVQRAGSYWIADGYGRGMWSGYGKIPTGSQGITLELAESFPLETDFKSNRINTRATGSLLKQVGFKAESKKIGQLAERKTISEAIVAIPFLDQPVSGLTTFVDGYHFFSINPYIFENQRTQLELNTLPKETSISRMIRLMKQYVIPPNFDFLTYYKNPLVRAIRDNREGIEPFVMYMFEFTHELDQQDLADIWQGVMPKIAITAEKEQITFSHDIGENELFGENFKLPPNMRWMIFKVKKKAEWNYFAVTEDTKDDNRFKFNFANSQEAQTPDYSYNWPYDYFSLVELAKVDVTYEYGEKPVTTGSFDIDTVINTGIDNSRFAIGNKPETLNQGKTTSTGGKGPKRQPASGNYNKQNKTLGKRTRL
jgi:hypothetical protein